MIMEEWLGGLPPLCHNERERSNEYNVERKINIQSANEYPSCRFIHVHVQTITCYGIFIQQFIQCKLLGETLPGLLVI